LFGKRGGDGVEITEGGGNRPGVDENVPGEK